MLVVGVVGQGAAHVMGVVLGLLEEGSHMVVVQPVLDSMTVADGFDKAAVSQDAELVGNGGLRRASGDREVADAERTPGQGVEQPGAGRIRESIKGPDHQLEDLPLWDGRPAVGHGLRV